MNVGYSRSVTFEPKTELCLNFEFFSDKVFIKGKMPYEVFDSVDIYLTVINVISPLSKNVENLCYPHRHLRCNQTPKPKLSQNTNKEK